MKGGLEDEEENDGSYFSGGAVDASVDFPTGHGQELSVEHGSYLFINHAYSWGNNHLFFQ
jgi:hypothetical protein